MQQIYISRNGQQHGPYSLEDLDQMLQSESITGEDLYWHEGAESWRPVSQLPGYVAPPSSSPPPPPLPSTPYNPQTAPPPIPATSSTGKPWYRRTWVHVVLFIFFPYIQVPLMWFQKVFSMPTRITLTVIGLFFTIAYFAAPDSPRSTAASSDSSSSSSSPTRTAAKEELITWDEIDEIYDLKHKETDLRKKEAWKRFKGKKVSWDGTVTAVSDGFGGLTLQVKMDRDTLISDLLVRLKKSEREKALGLKQGDPVSFTGRLDDWGSIMPITLDQGELH